MTGPIYDYERQRWVQIDTATDTLIGHLMYSTPDGVEYEVNPDGSETYRNRPTYSQELPLLNPEIYANTLEELPAL